MTTDDNTSVRSARISRLMTSAFNAGVMSLVALMQYVFARH